MLPPALKEEVMPRKPSKLSESIHQQLNVYAIAAGAAGVSVLALAQSAEAKIVYTKAQEGIGLRHAYKLDLTHNGTIDFVLQETEGGSQGFKAIQLAAMVEMGNMVEGSTAPNGRGYGAALKAGAPIGGRQRFVGARSGEFMATVQQSDTVFLKYYGNWYNVTDRYLGFKFKIDGKTHYGWARLNVEFRGFAIKATLTGYAYETVPNKSIIAGATKGPDDDDQPAPMSLKPRTPEPAMLGMLAVGEPGLSIWRREES